MTDAINIKSVATTLGWDVAETVAAFVELRAAEGRRNAYYANIDPSGCQLQIDFFLNMYDLSESEGEAYARYVRETFAGKSRFLADEDLNSAWGIRAGERADFLPARFRQQPKPMPWEENETLPRPRRSAA
jgi:hypothetical protein